MDWTETWHKSIPLCRESSEFDENVDLIIWLLWLCPNLTTGDHKANETGTPAPGWDHRKSRRWRCMCVISFSAFDYKLTLTNTKHFSVLRRTPVAILYGCASVQTASQRAQKIIRKPTKSSPRMSMGVMYWQFDAAMRRPPPHLTHICPPNTQWD